MQRPLEPSTQLIFLQVAFLSPHLSPADFVVAPTSHVPRPVSIRVSLRSSLPLVQQAVQFSRIGVKTVTLASWRFFSTLQSSNFLHCVLSNVSSPGLAHGSGGRCGSPKVSAVSCALVKLIQEPRLEPALYCSIEMRNVRIVSGSCCR